MERHHLHQYLHRRSAVGFHFVHVQMSCKYNMHWFVPRRAVMERHLMCLHMRRRPDMERYCVRMPGRPDVERNFLYGIVHG